MNAFNYSGDEDMLLPDDAQFVKGVSGGAAYFPAGKGHIPFTGEAGELSVSFWRKWDGEREPHQRGLCSCKTFALFFKGKEKRLVVRIGEEEHRLEDEEDAEVFTHWCILFKRKGFFSLFKNGEKIFKTPAGNSPVDLSEGFNVGGGRTHAAFDEIRFYRGILSVDEIQGLYRLKTTGTELSQIEKVAARAAKVAAESAAEVLTALHTPHYLGTVKIAPKGAKVNIHLGRKNGLNHASIGDWILIIDSIPGYKKGWCYRWDGNTWQMLDPPDCYSSEYTASLKDMLELKDMFRDTKFFGSVFCHILGANEVIGQNFVAKRLKVDSDSERNTDFEVDINEDVGIRVLNYGEEIFAVRTDGTLFLNGSSLRIGPFYVAQGASSSSSISIGGKKVSVLFAELRRIGGIGSFVACQGTIDGSPISFFKLSASTKMTYPDITRNSERVQIARGRIDWITWHLESEEVATETIEFFDSRKNMRASILHEKFHIRNWKGVNGNTKYELDDPTLVNVLSPATDWNGVPLSYFIFKPTFVEDHLQLSSPDRYISSSGNVILKKGGSIVRLDDLPTSPDGLELGRLWIDAGGSLKVVQ